MILTATPMERTRAVETVAAAMRRFAAEDTHPVRRPPSLNRLRSAAMDARASTYGAGEPLGAIRPHRAEIGNPIVLPPRSWLKVIDEVCVRHRLHRKDVLAGWKVPAAVACRNEIWHELRSRFGASYARIGSRTGGFHHTTVMYGVRSHVATKANSHLSNEEK